MNYAGSTYQDASGYHAVIEDLVNGTKAECTHRHGNLRAAERCATEEERSRMKGFSKWERDAQNPRPTARRQPLTFAPMSTGEAVSDEDMASSHAYIASKDLLAVWHAFVAGAQKRPAGNLMFVGPSGSGKTDGARYLAALVGLDFTKVDSASMTDPESWFGTREIVVENGVAVTRYQPSAFVEAIQKPGVMLLDEINRVRDEHRNVLIPILDHTRAVMNPLTGQVIERHPMNFIIMSGNVGMAFTGTNAIDPAFTTRSRTFEFDYLDEKAERRVVMDATGCSEDDAYVFIRFANEVRAKAANDGEYSPVSTRELISMGELVADGLDRDLAVKVTVFNAASSEGGSGSIRQTLNNLWNGVRSATLKPEDRLGWVAPSARPVPPVSGASAAPSGWVCPDHGTAKRVPAGVSAKTGRAYSSFLACPVISCGKTEDNSSR